MAQVELGRINKVLCDIGRVAHRRNSTRVVYEVGATLVGIPLTYLIPTYRYGLVRNVIEGKIPKEIKTKDEALKIHHFNSLSALRRSESLIFNGLFSIFLGLFGYAMSQPMTSLITTTVWGLIGFGTSWGILSFTFRDNLRKARLASEASAILSSLSKDEIEKGYIRLGLVKREEFQKRN